MGISKKLTDVTPFVGVWIETQDSKDDEEYGTVTPFVGVWIETHQVHGLPTGRIVTPFVGVWIETPFYN